jgi:hypothetical protein
LAAGRDSGFFGFFCRDRACGLIKSVVIISATSVAPASLLPVPVARITANPSVFTGFAWPARCEYLSGVSPDRLNAALRACVMSRRGGRKNDLSLPCGGHVFAL